jgi:hypothetical protein
MVYPRPWCIAAAHRPGILLAPHRFAGRYDVAFALEGCTGWRYVAEELAAASRPDLGERQVWDREEQRGDRLSEDSSPSPQRWEKDFGNLAGTGITSKSWRNRSQPRPRLP